MSGFKSVCHERLFEHTKDCAVCQDKLFTLEYNKPSDLKAVLCESGARLALECDAEDAVNELISETRRRNRKPK